MDNDAWEYKVVTQTPNHLDNQAKLNRFGKDGWELVSVVILGTGGTIAAYLKRPQAAGSETEGEQKA